METLTTIKSVLWSALALLAANLGLVVYALVRIRRLGELKAKFFSGKSGADLEETINQLMEQISNLHSRHAQLTQEHDSLEHAFQFAVQKVGLVRFNPFGDGGGNFSFSLALLNAHNTGVVVTSMHGRESNRIYTKRIVGGASEVQLTHEELEALRLAAENHLQNRI